MTRMTTATLTVGPRTLSPWGDRAWRVALVAQHVTGGGSDYWIVTPTQPAQHPARPDVLLIEQPDDESAIDSVLMLLAVHLGDENVEGYLMDTANIELVDGVRVVAPFWDVSPAETRRFLSSKMAASVRLGLTVMDEHGVVTDELVSGLRSLGFDVDVFSLTSSSVSAG